MVNALTVYHSSSCRGIHTTMPLVLPPTFLRNPIRALKAALGFAGLPGSNSKGEISYLKETQDFANNETGSQGIQGTKPQVRMENGLACSKPEHIGRPLHMD